MIVCVDGWIEGWLVKCSPYPTLGRGYTYNIKFWKTFYTTKIITTAKYGREKKGVDKYSKEEVFIRLLHYSDLLCVLQAPFKGRKKMLCLCEDSSETEFIYRIKYTVFHKYLQGHGSGPFIDTKIQGFIRPLCKWCRPMHTVSSLPPQILYRRSKILFSICSWLNPQMWNPGMQKADYTFIGKKSVYKWTSVDQTHVVQGSAMHWAPALSEHMGGTGDRDRHGLCTAGAYSLEKGCRNLEFFKHSE